MTARPARKPQSAAPHEQRLAEEDAVRRILRGVEHPPSPVPHPHFLTDTPGAHEFGKKVAASSPPLPPADETEASPQGIAAQGDSSPARSDEKAAEQGAAAGLFCHQDSAAGKQPPPLPAESPAAGDTDDPLAALVGRSLAQRRIGRPALFDDQAKGKLIALLAFGLSLRQAGAVLGVSHQTVSNTLKADPALAEEITAARFAAQAQPLACVIREARRSWKAATWLLKYLDQKVKAHDETPEEKLQRERRESDEFFEHSRKRSIALKEKYG
jgi:hypothetical protein